MIDLHLVLPYPPSINSYYGRTRTGQVYIKEKGRDYRKHLVETINSLETFSERIQLEVLLFPPDRRRRDLDNILKCLLDALTHSKVYEDDSQIDVLIVKRKDIIKNGKCEVLITKL